MDFEKRISDYGMTPEQYEASFAEITAKVQGNSDKDWTEIIDQYSIPLSRNTLRNACSNVYGSVFVKEYFDEKRRKEMEVIVNQLQTNRLLSRFQDIKNRQM